MQIWSVDNDTDKSWKKRRFHNFPNKRGLFNLVHTHLEDSRVAKKPLRTHYIVFSKEEERVLTNLLKPLFNRVTADVLRCQLDAVFARYKETGMVWTSFVSVNRQLPIMDKKNPLRLAIIIHRPTQP